MPDGSIPARARNLAPIVLVLVLVSWLVVQNAALLLIWSWPAVPALLSVARALLKVGAIVVVQLLPAALIAGGAVLLWAAARRVPAPPARRLHGVRHG